MQNYQYETHSMANPLLPFIFHPKFIISSRNKHPNWHENIELLQAIEGSGYVHCGADTHPFSQGDIFVVNADILHSIGTDDRLVYRCLIIDNSFITANGIPIDAIHFQSTIHDPVLFACFEQIANRYLDLDPNEYQTILALRIEVLHLMQLLCKNYSSPRLADPSNTYVKATIHYLRQHLAETIHLDLLSGEIGLSKYHLCRIFKQATGKTIVEALNLMRCTEAQRLIEGGIAVGAAAEACGFNNLSYFTRTFASCFGKVPSAFKPK